ncbi:MAG: GntR family transcriptional regulator [Planctomycetes bacterium]|nr:GntR family transcriptional regulator [Planctomycetota bacterium]
MFFRVDPDNGVAIYDQIARQVKYAVANGALRAGEMVPSVRELALLLAVNPNTVAKAYRDLQNDSVLEAMRGEGLRVARQAVERCRKARQRLLEERMTAMVTEALQSGLNEDEFFTLVRDVWKSVGNNGVVQKQSLSQKSS